MLVLAAAITLATFAVLIETWRRMVIAWGEPLSFADAAAIWFVSSLVRYVPYNFVFQVGAIAELSRRRKISPATAAGASLINVAVNLATGFIVALVVGYDALDKISRGHAEAGVAIAGVMLIGILALPALLPHSLGLLRAITGRELALGRLPVRAIYISLIGNLIAWILYGVMYRALAIGVVGAAPGSVGDYIAVYAGAYVIGYLAFTLPAGAGVREGVQLDALPILGLATYPQALAIAVSARLLSMILEIVPGLLFLMRGTRLRPPAPTSIDGSTR
jgi:hypothetical protein